MNMHRKSKFGIIILIGCFFVSNIYSMLPIRIKKVKQLSLPKEENKLIKKEARKLFFGKVTIHELSNKYKKETRDLIFKEMSKIPLRCNICKTYLTKFDKYYPSCCKNLDESFCRHCALSISSVLGIKCKTCRANLKLKNYDNSSVITSIDFVDKDNLSDFFAYRILLGTLILPGKLKINKRFKNYESSFGCFKCNKKLINSTCNNFYCKNCYTYDRESLGRALYKVVLSFTETIYVDNYDNLVDQVLEKLSCKSYCDICHKYFYKNMQYDRYYFKCDNCCHCYKKFYVCLDCVVFYLKGRDTCPMCDQNSETLTFVNELSGLEITKYC